jgi:hypothetical protein
LVPVATTFIGLGAGTLLSYLNETKLAKRARRVHWQDVRTSAYTRFMLLANEAERAREGDSQQSPSGDSGVVSYAKSNELVVALYLLSEELHLIASTKVMKTASPLRDALGHTAWDLPRNGADAAPKDEAFLAEHKERYLAARRAFLAAARADAGVEG